jgi:imidazolonepropionase
LSGYGLTLESEIKMLECVQKLAKKASIELVPTFLPAHAVPPEFAGRTDSFVDAICKEWIPEIVHRKLAVFFDAFVEDGYFSTVQSRKMAEAASAHGLKIKLHVDQFTDQGGTALAVDLGATSCDHLDSVSSAGVKKIAASSTVAVLAPGASLFTGTPYPPARALIDSGAIVALTTDFNPGTCPSHNLPLMMTIACSQMKMTIPESIVAATYYAAQSLGREADFGALLPGRPLNVWKLRVSDYRQIPYCFGDLVR